MVAARAIVRDLFDVNQNAKVFSMLMLVVAVSPIIAPTAGGYITATFGWRVVFWALVVIAIAILAGIYFILPESKKPDPNFSLKAKPMLKNYWSILQHPQFYTFAFTGAIAYGGLYAYVSGSPQVFMGVFAVSEKQFGWIFAAIAIGLITASQINNRLLKKYSSEQIIMMALAFQSLIGIVLFSGAVLQLLNLPLTITLIFLFLSCQGFIFPNASALTMAAFGHTAGSASGLMGAIQLSVGALASAIVSKLENQTTLPMTGVMCFCASLALFIFIAGRKMQIRKATLLAVEEEEVDMMGNL
jgi:DHA1 family bicyclomycin/chloramphenicol resistance-like MFS transporter